MSQFAFKRTGDADYPQHLKVLLQGPPKSGKTSFIATAPNVVVAACEAGLASIAHLDVPYVPIDGTDKIQSLLMVLKDESLRAGAARSLEMPAIETVAIDTLDAWQEMLKKEIMAENRRTSFQQADWGTLKERMATLMKAFVALPMNVIFTVHTSTTMDDESRMIYAPALQGSIKDEIAGYVDFSLLSYRERETNAKGQSRISYYLKCEGDQKNPHLGNRAAGRLPEIVEPKFMKLHAAVFSAVRRKPEVATEESALNSVSSTTHIIHETDTAHSASHAVVTEATPAASQEKAAPATETAQKTERPKGVPANNPDAKINASGLTMLTRSYTENGLVVPEDLKSWKLTHAHEVARFFTAWAADKAAGQASATIEDLIALLEAKDAYAGKLPGVQTGTADLKSKSADKTEKPSADDEAVTKAVKVVEEKLDGKVVSYGAKEDAKCEECGKKCDDQDIANLAVMKFKRALCVEDYKKAVKAAK